MLNNVEGHSLPSLVLYAMNIRPECQICSWVVPLPRKGIWIRLCNKLQIVSCTFRHVTTQGKNQKVRELLILSNFHLFVLKTHTHNKVQVKELAGKQKVFDFK